MGSSDLVFFPQMCRFSLSFILLAMGVSLAGCGSPANVIKIGCAAPLTGDQAQMGSDACNGVKLAVEHANAKGEVIPGMVLEAAPFDDQHNPAQAVNVAKKYVSDPAVLGVMGHFNSSCTKPASAIYNEARLVHVSASNTNPDLSRQGFDTFFRVCATDEVQGPKAARYAVNKLGAKSVFLFDDKTTYGKGLADEFEKEARKLGVTVLGHEGITQGDKDFSPLLTRIKPLAPDLVYFGGIYPEGALIVRQARALGLTAVFMGGDGLANPLFAQLASPENAEGSYASMIGADAKQIPEAQAFIKDYEARFGPVGQFSAYAYDAASVLIEAIRKAGRKDREAVVQAMKQIKDFPGVTGPVAFDGNGDNTNQFIGMYKFENGRIVYTGPAE